VLNIVDSLIKESLNSFKLVRGPLSGSVFVLVNQVLVLDEF
jgi:hypothetical protein